MKHQNIAQRKIWYKWNKRNDLFLEVILGPALKSDLSEGEADEEA